jgi:serine/threonine protein phosphatase PrpC
LASTRTLLNSETSLERGVSNLIDLANQHNGHDNITTLLIRAKCCLTWTRNRTEISILDFGCTKIAYGHANSVKFPNEHPTATMAL